jgi:hypothetical protein
MRKPLAGTNSNSYFRSSPARSQGIVDFARVTQVTALANRSLDLPVLAGCAFGGSEHRLYNV